MWGGHVQVGKIKLKHNWIPQLPRQLKRFSAYISLIVLATYAGAWLQEERVRWQRISALNSRIGLQVVDWILVNTFLTAHGIVLRRSYLGVSKFSGWLAPWLNWNQNESNITLEWRSSISLSVSGIETGRIIKPHHLSCAEQVTLESAEIGVVVNWSGPLRDYWKRQITEI